MSKRRNLKKEKAQRNQAYARQFRRKSTQIQEEATDNIIADEMNQLALRRKTIT